MRAAHLRLGEQGEALAVAYLCNQGYEILECNWRHKNLEIDIIAKHENVLAFIEVKTRSYTFYGEPSDFVDLRKQRKLIRASEIYIYKSKYEGEIRYDIVSIVWGEKQQIELIKDAFWSS